MLNICNFICQLYFNKIEGTGKVQKKILKTPKLVKMIKLMLYIFIEQSLKGWRTIYHTNNNQKKAGLLIVISEKANFR